MGRIRSKRKDAGNGSFQIRFDIPLYKEITAVILKKKYRGTEREFIETATIEKLDKCYDKNKPAYIDERLKVIEVKGIRGGCPKKEQKKRIEK